MHSTTRRSFVRSLGAAGLFAPFLGMLQPRPAKAAVGSAKYLLIFHTTGTDPTLWHPDGSTANEIVFSEMLEPLDAIRDSVVLIDRLDSMGTAGGHAAPGGLSGQTYGAAKISLDQFVADRLESQGVVTPFGALLMGGDGGQSQSTFFRDGQALTPLLSPVDMFATVFGGVGGSNPEDIVAAQERLARRQSILDLSTDQLRTLQGALGSQEREKLELHVDSIRELEERLVLGMGGGGKPSEGCEELSSPNNDTEPLLNYALMADMATNAFACDLTRVAAVEFGHHQAMPVSLPEVGSGDWHGFLHNMSNEGQKLINLERWIAQEFVNVAQKLMSLPAPDGGGSLYDQTLMIWTRGMGDAVNHGGDNIPLVLAGATSYLNGTANGRYIDGGGQPHQRVLFNCCEALGVTNLEGFGNPNTGLREPLTEVGG